MDRTVGLRERKKAATRHALHEAAVRLAVEHGFDKGTIEAIADAANVSRRTFSNYFAGKEEAFFHGDSARLRRLLQLIAGRPAGEPPWTALSRAAEQFIAEGDPFDPLWQAQRRLIRDHPGLATHQIGVFARVERDIADEISRRIPQADDGLLQARVLAARFLSTLRAATQFWIDHPQRSLADLVSSALAYTSHD